MTKTAAVAKKEDIIHQGSMISLQSGYGLTDLSEVDISKLLKELKFLFKYVNRNVFFLLLVQCS